ncbi:MAG TPA: hypothetical protein VM689_11645 [Aliidongia sp.]|nr:hypothetical protein [Aliidongia sp.]
MSAQKLLFNHGDLVAAGINLCADRIRALEAQGKFPRALTLTPGRTSQRFWLASSITAWLEERASASEADAAARIASARAQVPGRRPRSSSIDAARRRAERHEALAVVARRQVAEFEAQRDQATKR